MEADTPPQERQPLWFLLLLALAVAGGAVAYVPFLTVLLPVRISELMGGEDVAALSYSTFAGAVIASLANIGFGWLSDRSGTRRGWILAGMIASGLLLVCVGYATSLSQIIAIVMVWQLSLNMMLSPLLAWAGDCVPDEQKGLLGGLFALAPALGALSGAFVTFPGLANGQTRLVLVAAIVGVMIAPALIFGGGRRMPRLMKPADKLSQRAEAGKRQRKAIVGMWTARLLVQISEAALFAFLLFWMRSITPDFGENRAANIFSVVLIVAVPIALVAGRWSDRHGRPMVPLAICAALSSLGLIAMALATTENSALAGYVLFGISSMTFLSLHSSQTLRVLPRPQHRARDLGFFNLTNTVPSLIIPGLTLALVPVAGFSALFVLLAALAAIACLLILFLARAR